MKILHILGELRPSGAEVMLRVAARHWCGGALSHEVLATGPSEGPYAGVLREAGYSVHHLRFSRSFLYFRRLYELLRERGYQVVHIHTEQANLPYALAARAAGVRRIVRTIHSSFPFSGRLRHSRRLQRALLRRMGVRQVAVGRSVSANELRRFCNATLEIPSWYDSALFRPPSAGERESARQALGIAGSRPVLATVGNCEPVKNHPLVLRALALLLRQRPDWFYVHAGGEDPEQTDRRLAEHLGIAGQCAFLGFTGDPRAALWAADLFAMPSAREGFSIAALEAAACGLPLLLTDVAGLRDLQNRIPRARWVPPEPAALAAAAGDIYRQWPACSLENAAAARSAFGVEAGARAYTELYAAPEISC